MNKKIKIIDLLNKIANGEEVPKRIKSEDREFWFKEDETSIDYLYRTDKNGNGWLVVQDLALNDWVEILEDNTEEIEELSTYRTFAEYDELAKKCINMNAEQFFYKINELVKAVNSIRKDKNNE